MIAAAPLAPEAGILGCSLAVAGAFVLRQQRARAICVLVALVLTPLLLVGDLWDSPQIESLRDRPAISLAAVAAGLAATAGLAALFMRRPHAFPLLAVVALPFRVPVEAAGDTFNLLLPFCGRRRRSRHLRRLRDGPQPEREPCRQLACCSWSRSNGQAAYSPIRQGPLDVVLFYVPFALRLSCSRRSTGPRASPVLLGAPRAGSSRLDRLLGVRAAAALNPDYSRQPVKDTYLVNSLSSIRTSTAASSRS